MLYPTLKHPKAIRLFSICDAASPATRANLVNGKLTKKPKESKQCLRHLQWGYSPDYG